MVKVSFYPIIKQDYKKAREKLLELINQEEIKQKLENGQKLVVVLTPEDFDEWGLRFVSDKTKMSSPNSLQIPPYKVIVRWKPKEKVIQISIYKKQDTIVLKPGGGDSSASS